MALRRIRRSGEGGSGCRSANESGACDRVGPAEYAVTLIDGPSTVVHFHDFLYLYPEIVTPGMDGSGGFKRTMRTGAVPSQAMPEN